jgi:hypothetical protein
MLHPRSILRGIGKVSLALFPLLAIGTGCADHRFPLGPVNGPNIVASQPLPGELKVMLPYDVRPSVEHYGSMPGTKYFTYAVVYAHDEQRGNYVTSDDGFRVPYEDGEGGSKYGTDPSVPAAVGEDVFNCIQNAHVFEKVSRLRPDGGSWQLPDKGARVERIAAGPPGLLALNPAEQDSQDMDLRAQAAPLPPCDSEWLLRTRILHLYGCRFADTTSMSIIGPAPGGTATYSQTLPKQYVPEGNAVLAFDLYHNTGGRFQLVWDRTCDAAFHNPRASNAHLALHSLSAALDQMVESLVRDAPRIRAATATGSSASHTSLSLFTK